MDFDTTEDEIQGSLDPLTPDNMPTTSWAETFGLAVQSTLATENTTSEYNYFKEVIAGQSSELIARSPNDKDFIERYSNTYADPSYNTPRMLLKDGSITYDENTQEYTGKSSIARTYIKKYKDKLDNITKYDGLVKQYGLLDRDGLVAKSKGQAYNDYMKAEQRLEASGGFMNGLAKFSGSMYGAMKDPVNIMLLPVGGSAKLVGTGGAAIAKTAGVAAWQEAKIAAVAEVPIQMQAYNWKNNIGLQWDYKDALLSAAASIGASSIIRAGGSATMDISKTALDNLKIKAVETKNKDLAEAVEAYENSVSKSPLNNVDDHFEAETVAHQQVVNGEAVDVADIVRESGDFNALGARINEAEGQPTIHETIQNELPPEPYPLYNVDLKPIVKEVEAPVEGKAVETQIEEPPVKLDYNELDEMNIENSGKNTLEEYKVQELTEWAKTLEDDIIIPTKTIDEKGQTMTKEVSFRESIAEIEKDQAGLQKLLDCAG